MGCGISASIHPGIPVQMGTEFTPMKFHDNINIIIAMTMALPAGGFLGHDSYILSETQEDYRKELVKKLHNAASSIGRKPYISLDEEIQFKSLDKIRYDGSKEKTMSLVDVLGSDASTWVDHQLWKVAERYNVYKAVFRLD